MRARSTTILLLAAALAMVALLAGCGGGDAANEDPQTVLDNAFGGDGGGVDSGVLDVTLDVEATGDQAGNLAAELQGPFKSNGTGNLPSADFDLTASLDAGGSSFDFDGGLTLTEDGAWVGFQGDEYQLDDATFAALKTSYEQSAAQQSDQEAQTSLQQLGVDPRDWVTDLSNEGTEDLDGTEVVHVSGSVDVPKLVADLNDAARQTGQAQQIDPGTLEQLQDTVTDAKMDVYAASDDDSLRKIDIALTLADPGGGSGQATVGLSIAIADPNSDQSISAPSDAKPLSDLLDRLPGGAATLGGLGAGATSPAPQASSSAKRYYDCVAKAKSAQAVEDCASLLGG